jgi:putative hydrolase of the HAD superfamily
MNTKNHNSSYRPVRAVLFDLFYTLVRFSDHPVGSSTSEILGIAPEVWSKKLMDDSPHHALGEVKDPVESVRIIAHSIDPTIPEEKIIEACNARPDRFRDTLLQVHSSVLGGLDRIREMGLKTALISNAGYDEVEAWDDSPLASRFDEMIASCHVGLMKPQPEIYQLAASRLGVGLDECLFVGDGGSSEHVGANNVGMQNVLFLQFLNESSPKAAANRPRITDWVIDSFDELVELVDGLRKQGGRR